MNPTKQVDRSALFAFAPMVASSVGSSILIGNSIELTTIIGASVLAFSLILWIAMRLFVSHFDRRA